MSLLLEFVAPCGPNLIDVRQGKYKRGWDVVETVSLRVPGFFRSITRDGMADWAGDQLAVWSAWGWCPILSSGYVPLFSGGGRLRTKIN
eukprot:g28663.t1